MRFSDTWSPRVIARAMAARSTLVAVCMLAACSFAPRPGESSPGDGPAADSADDPAPDATPTFRVIETLTVDSANPAPTVSETVLAEGVTYHLRVSGVITNVIDQFQGDADFYDFEAPKDDGCCEDIGLGIDDFVVDDHDTKPDWGPYRANHTYEVSWVGEGKTISALFQDTFYGNNIGNLTLEILELQ